MILPRLPHAPVISHWHKSVADFETSPMNFYGDVERALRARGAPEVRISHVEYQEGGMFSPARVYLRVTRRHLAFDICAAPFGKDFFFSWWLTEARTFKFGCLLVVVLIGIAGAIFNTWGWKGFLFVWFALLGAMWVLAAGARGGWLLSEDTILTIPYLGAFYTLFFQPATYYRMDTTLMFQDSVHTTVLEVVEGLLTTKGLRALSPDERKPVVRNLVG